MAERVRRETPTSYDEAAAALRGCAEEGLAVRFVGGGTKRGWGAPVTADVELATGKLDRIVEHNAGDLTAILQAGIPLAAAQKAFAEAGQMLALDPPLGPGEAATIGGIIATGDSGPLRHRYGAPRDLVIGIAVALSDGTVARSGGKVIKNVAGYDLGKLFAGSFGTLGLILELAIRLHPLPKGRATATGRTGARERLAAASLALTGRSIEAESIDVEWRRGSGAVHARFAGAEAEAQAHAAGRLLAGHGLDVSVETDDAAVWEAQRAGARSESGVVVRVSGLPSELARVVQAAEQASGALVGRSALGVSWIAVPDPARVAQLRRDVAPFPCAVLDAPVETPGRVDPWGLEEGPELALMQRVKERFDPAGVCNPRILGAI